MRAICVFLSLHENVKNETSMKIFVETVMFVLSVSLAVVQLYRNRKYNEMKRTESGCSPYVFLSAAWVIIAGLLSGSCCGAGLVISLMPSLACMSLLASSLLDTDHVKRWVCLFVSLNIVYACWLFLKTFIDVPSVPDSLEVLLLMVFILMQAAFFVAGLYRRLKSVKIVIKTGTVWANIGIGVDAHYLLVETVIVIAYMAVSLVSGCTEGVHAAVSFLLLGGLLAAYGARVMMDSVFVLWKKQEQKIVEALKVTVVESASDASRIDIVYKDIYERVVAYFEREKPFLDSELTINDLVKVIYSNKLYISRAISQFTGRNFCQFVNYYRIKYSTECFKANHELKIHEMASMSGFNSIVTFNMAFRLYMGENPSDWCRKEKGRFVKGQK